MRQCFQPGAWSLQVLPTRKDLANLPHIADQSAEVVSAGFRANIRSLLPACWGKKRGRFVQGKVEMAEIFNSQRPEYLSVATRFLADIRVQPVMADVQPPNNLDSNSWQQDT